jgi:hypothetical protein
MVWLAGLPASVGRFRSEQVANAAAVLAAGQALGVDLSPLSSTFFYHSPFAGAERKYARAIYEIATANALRVFLDEEFQHEIWGKTST